MFLINVIGTLYTLLIGTLIGERENKRKQKVYTYRIPIDSSGMSFSLLKYLHPFTTGEKSFSVLKGNPLCSYRGFHASP